MRQEPQCAADCSRVSCGAVAEVLVNRDPCRVGFLPTPITFRRVEVRIHLSTGSAHQQQTELGEADNPLVGGGRRPRTAVAPNARAIHAKGGRSRGPPGCLVRCCSQVKNHNGRWRCGLRWQRPHLWWEGRYEGWAQAMVVCRAWGRRTLVRRLGQAVQRASRSLLAVALIATLSTVTSACDSATSPIGDDSFEPVDADAQHLRDMRKYSSRWNQILTPIVNDYMDPNVSAAAWVTDAGPAIGQLGEALTAMRALAIQIDDSEARAQVDPLIENYERKFGAFSRLVYAVSDGDGRGERRALTELDPAAQEGIALAEELFRQG